MFFSNKKCRIYAARGVSQTPKLLKKEGSRERIKEYIKEAFIGFGTIGVERSKIMKVTAEIATELENKRNYTR